MRTRRATSTRLQSTGAAAVVAWDHTSLAVTDIARSLEFYRVAFGYELVSAHRGMTDLIERIAGMRGLTCDLVQLRLPASQHRLELISFRPPAREDRVRPPTGHVAFVVADLDASLEAVERLGAERLGEVTTFPEGRAVYCREPGASVFELFQLAVESGDRAEDS